MKPTIECDNCKFEWILNELDIEESTVKKAGEIEKCIVQYFRCPNCKEKYIVVVYDDKINALTAKYKELMKHHEDMTLAKFKTASDRLKKQIEAEESMLLHLYLKQHKEETRHAM